jgi:thiamine biosynthesis lipoprotein ApbE
MNNPNEMHSIAESGMEKHYIEVDGKAYNVIFHIDLRNLASTGL